MNEACNTLDKEMKSLRMLHPALKTGVLLIIGIMYFLGMDEYGFEKNQINLFLGIRIMIFSTLIFMSPYLYQSMMLKHGLIQYGDQQCAINDFRSINIIKWVLLEGVDDIQNNYQIKQPKK